MGPLVLTYYSGCSGQGLWWLVAVGRALKQWVGPIVGAVNRAYCGCIWQGPEGGWRRAVGGPEEGPEGPMAHADCNGMTFDNAIAAMETQFQTPTKSSEVRIPIEAKVGFLFFIIHFNYSISIKPSSYQWHLDNVLMLFYLLYSMFFWPQYFINWSARL